VTWERAFSETIHATGFSQWLMTEFLSAEFIRRLEILVSVSPFYPDLPICRRVLARQEPCPPIISPTKVGAQFLRHQLRTEVRSMG